VSEGPFCITSIRGLSENMSTSSTINRLWEREIMMFGVDPWQFSGLSSGHAFQPEKLNIGSQVNGEIMMFGV